MPRVKPSELQALIEEVSVDCPNCGSDLPHDELTCVKHDGCTMCLSVHHENGACLFFIEQELNPIPINVTEERTDIYDWCSYCGYICDGMCMWHDDLHDRELMESAPVRPIYDQTV